MLLFMLIFLIVFIIMFIFLYDEFYDSEDLFFIIFNSLIIAFFIFIISLIISNNTMEFTDKIIAEHEVIEVENYIPSLNQNITYIDGSCVKTISIKQCTIVTRTDIDKPILKEVKRVPLNPNILFTKKLLTTSKTIIEIPYNKNLTKEVN